MANPTNTRVRADIAEFAGGEMIGVQSGNPFKVEAMLVERSQQKTLLLANLTPASQIATMDGIPSAARLRRLHEQTAEVAMREPETFRRQHARNEFLTERIVLFPFEIIRLDW